jgi:hypothetical protein
MHKSGKALHMLHLTGKLNEELETQRLEKVKSSSSLAYNFYKKAEHAP